MNTIGQNWRTLRSSLPDEVLLLAVSKYHTIDDIREAYAAGCRDFGESRVQELVVKQAALPEDIRWHFIGHLQTNKLKMVLPYVTLIHSVDSERLLSAIDQAARLQGRRVDCLLEVHIAREATKQGFLPEEAEALARRIGDYPGIRLRGVMGMATFTDDTEVVRGEFRTLKALADRLSDIPDCDQVSMGMSEDWSIAVEEGTTLVRIGTFIFGKRN